MTLFEKRCYALLAQIPKGRVTTYGAIARALNTKAYQAVGSAMKRNPNPIIVPCHRVVNSSAKVGGYAYGQDKKIELLQQEGIEIKEGKIQNFKEVMFYNDEAISLSAI